MAKKSPTTNPSALNCKGAARYSVPKRSAEAGTDAARSKPGMDLLGHPDAALIALGRQLDELLASFSEAAREMRRRWLIWNYECERHDLTILPAPRTPEREAFDAATQKLSRQVGYRQRYDYCVRLCDEIDAVVADIGRYQAHTIAGLAVKAMRMRARTEFEITADFRCPTEVDAAQAVAEFMGEINRLAGAATKGSVAA